MDETTYPGFTREHYGACSGGHAATVITEGFVKPERVLAFIAESTGLKGWSVEFLKQRDIVRIAWVLRRSDPKEEVPHAKRRRY